MVTVVGIDLGATTSRCAELLSDKRMPIVVRSKLSNESTPSISYFPPVKEGNRQFGEAVATKDITSPANTVADLKDWVLKFPQSTRAFPSVLEKEVDLPLTSSQVLGFVLRQILDNTPSYKKYLLNELESLHIVLSIPNGSMNSPSESSTLEVVRQAIALCCEKEEGDGLKVAVVDESEATLAYFHHLRFDSHETDGPVTIVANVGHKYCTITATKVLKGSVVKLASVCIELGSSSIDEGLCDLVFEDIFLKQHKDIKHHTKSFKKVLRECKKAKEILSSVDSAIVQLEGLAEDTDVRIQLLRGQLVTCGNTLVGTLRHAILTSIVPAIDDAIASGAVRLECVGGGWRSHCVQEVLKEVFGVSQISVTLDSNLCVAEGCSILGMISLIQRMDLDKVANIDPIHKVEMAHSCDFTSLSPSSLPDQWRVAEKMMTKADANFVEYSTAVDNLQSLVYSTQSLLARAGGASDATYDKLVALLDEIDSLASDEGTTVDVLKSTFTRIEEKLNAIPEIATQKQKEEAEVKRKEEEFVRLSKLKTEENDLKSDPQRFRVAQQRREQGVELFKQEFWEESQTRFVQALCILGQLYDTANEDNIRKKREISLSCHLNIASCCVKLGRWRIAVSNCSDALELSPDNPKALFRRGQAQSALGNFKEALSDLSRAKELTGGDSNILAELDNLKFKIEQEKTKEKKIFSKMFA